MPKACSTPCRSFPRPWSSPSSMLTLPDRSSGDARSRAAYRSGAIRRLGLPGRSLQDFTEIRQPIAPAPDGSRRSLTGVARCTNGERTVLAVRRDGKIGPRAACQRGQIRPDAVGAPAYRAGPPGRFRGYGISRQETCHSADDFEKADAIAGKLDDEVPPPMWWARPSSRFNMNSNDGFSDRVIRLEPPRRRLMIAERSPQVRKRAGERRRGASSLTPGTATVSTERTLDQGWATVGRPSSGHGASARP